MLSDTKKIQSDKPKMRESQYNKHIISSTNKYQEKVWVRDCYKLKDSRDRVATNTM